MPVIRLPPKPATPRDPPCDHKGSLVTVYLKGKAQTVCQACGEVVKSG